MSNRASCLRFPKLVGMMPCNLFFPKYSHDNRVRLPTVYGIDPMKSFFIRYSSVNSICKIANSGWNSSSEVVLLKM